MPIRLGRVPVPSLRTYTLISFLFMGTCLWSAHENVYLFDLAQEMSSSSVPLTMNTETPLETPPGYSYKENVQTDPSITLLPDTNEKMSVEKTETGWKILYSNNKEEIKEKDYLSYSEELVSKKQESVVDNNWTDGSVEKDDEQRTKWRSDDDDEYESPFMDYTLHSSDSYAMKLFKAFMQEPIRVLALINFVYCCMFLFAKVIQLLIIGKLRVSERQRLKEKFGNFVFYKFIFIFGVLNVQLLEEMVLWSAWFSLLAFLHLFVILSKDRSDYLSSSPTTSKFKHGKVMGLLISILIVGIILVGVCFYVGYSIDINTFFFMLAECVILLVRTIFVIVKYSIHLYDLHHDGLWEERGSFIYYTDLIFDTTGLIVDFLHHLHMLLWGNIFLSMASLVICMQLRYLYTEIQRKLRKHKNYRRVVNNLENRFSYATKEELENGDDTCAICWDQMSTARKLPCNHFFHNSCLRSWLEHDTSCPTCRKSLSLNPVQTGPTNRENLQNQPQRGGAMRARVAVRGGQQGLVNRRNVFHFDGSRFFAWLPSFSVEVMHTGNIMRQQPNSQLHTWANNVHQMFPNVPLPIILEDLQRTRSMEITIDNILEQRILIPEVPLPDEPAPPPPNEDEDRHPVEPQNRPVQFNANTNPHANLSPSYSVESHNEELTPNHHMVTEAGDANASQPSPRDQEPFTEFSNIEAVPSRFSKSASEREEILNQRKKGLMQKARKRYMMKHIGEASFQTTPSSSTRGSINDDGSSPRIAIQNNQQMDDSSLQDGVVNPNQSDVRQRRILAFEAARRRMQDGE